MYFCMLHHNSIAAFLLWMRCLDQKLNILSINTSQKKAIAWLKIEKVVIRHSADYLFAQLFIYCYLLLVEETHVLLQYYVTFKIFKLNSNRSCLLLFFHFCFYSIFNFCILAMLKRFWVSKICLINKMHYITILLSHVKKRQLGSIVTCKMQRGIREKKKNPHVEQFIFSKLGYLLKYKFQKVTLGIFIKWSWPLSHLVPDLSTLLY